MEYVKEELPHFKIFETIIRKNVAIPESQSAQQDIFTYNDKCHGAEDYMNLSKEILNVKEESLTQA
ncbi:ParA family protein [Xanthovirga aplysinae]|uniref:ParA family protein n=1 Tax=Xanthovirga aplysinae TaxID=2529853 RepID=UPI001FE7013A|nr:hypothetical protein [Xanthovirga aplysinae]